MHFNEVVVDFYYEQFVKVRQSWPIAAKAYLVVNHHSNEWWNDVALPLHPREKFKLNETVLARLYSANFTDILQYCKANHSWCSASIASERIALSKHLYCLLICLCVNSKLSWSTNWNEMESTTHQLYFIIANK